jgi:hypothetical protein
MQKKNYEYGRETDNWASYGKRNKKKCEVTHGRYIQNIDTGLISRSTHFFGLKN